MKLYVDLDSLSLISQPGYSHPVEQIYVRRDDTVPFTVQFVQSGVIVDPGTASVYFIAKTAANYNESPALVPLSTVFAKTGTGTSTIFSQSIAFTGTALDTALSVVAGLGIESIAAMGEISWSIAGVYTTARKFTVTIELDLNRA